MIDFLLEHSADAHAIGAGRWVLDPEIAPRLAGSGPRLVSGSTAKSPAIG
jgi:hypothetical protein